MKERIVDLLVVRLFEDLLPDYQIQNMGDTRIDKYLETQADIKELAVKIETVLK